MARRTATVVNKRGLHARASAKFVGTVAELPAGVGVRVAKGGPAVDGDSILDLMMLGAARGDEIEIIVEGENADVVLAQLCQLVADGFGEE